MPVPAVFVFGEKGIDDSENVRLIGEPLASASSSRLNEILNEAPNVALVDGRLANAAAISELPDTDSHSVAVALLPIGSGRDFEFLCSHLPISLASLAMAPEGRCAVLVNSEKVREAGGFRDVESPVRELIVRLSLRDPSSVALLNRDLEDTSTTTFALPSIDADLPLVAPHWPPRSHDWLRSALSALEIPDALPGISSAVEATALHAGLWQINDWLDESHNCSQSIEGKGEGNGDFWHAIMHRREPDPSNSKYWFRRVGQHACFEPLAATAAIALNECGSPEAGTWKKRLGTSGRWDPTAFVDLCQATSRAGDEELAQAARRIQWAEMLLLLGQTAQAAT
jgi:hypothetical protein